MDKISTNHIVKVGIVVKDIEQAAKYYAELFNIPVPEVKTPNPNAVMPANASTWYRGADKAFKCRTAIIRLEPIYIELIEPLDGPSPWSEFKQEHGQGVHYLAFNVEGFQDHIDLLNAKGMPVFYKQDKGKERYAYFETEEKLGVTLEFKEVDKD
jgi:methylmalonyl-CoA/ethylmalonyl-CoA epimerase